MTAICPDECDMLARRTEAYVASVRSRLLPAISSLDESVYERKNDAFNAVMEWTARHYGESDIDSALSTASDIEEDAVDDWLFVNEQVLNLAIAGLFHFWEKSMRRVLIRAPRLGVLAPPSKWVENAKPKELVAALQKSGNRAPSVELLKELDELALVTNAVKHGSGRALRKLAQQFPIFVDGENPQKVIPEQLRVSEDDFTRFGLAVAAFWRSVARPFLPTRQRLEIPNPRQF